MDTFLHDNDGCPVAQLIGHDADGCPEIVDTEYDHASHATWFRVRMAGLTTRPAPADHVDTTPELMPAKRTRAQGA